MKKITSNQAKEIYKSGIWNKWSKEKIAWFQLNNQYLAVPFDKFHEAVEYVLGRGVFTHEFAHPERLIAEIKGDRNKPDLEQILQELHKDYPDKEIITMDISELKEKQKG